jgi:hypothetical protein
VVDPVPLSGGGHVGAAMAMSAAVMNSVVT